MIDVKSARGPKNTDEYLAGLPPDVRRILTRVRSTIRKAVRGAEESISYGIPTYKLAGRPVVYFAGWKAHYSLYPATTRLVAAFEKELAPYEISKGTIRFPFTEPVPVKLIDGITRFRARDVGAPAKPKAGAAAKKR